MTDPDYHHREALRLKAEVVGVNVGTALTLSVRFFELQQQGIQFATILLSQPELRQAALQLRTAA